jgi:hypothetical protein
MMSYIEGAIRPSCDNYVVLHKEYSQGIPIILPYTQTLAVGSYIDFHSPAHWILLPAEGVTVKALGLHAVGREFDSDSEGFFRASYSENG